MTIIPFLPNQNAAPPFQSSVTLDGNAYLLTCQSNFYRGDYYVGLTDQGGNTIAFQPLIGSPPESEILLFPGLFQTSTVVYYPGTTQFVIDP